MLIRIDHIGIAVKSIEDAMKIYGDALGLKIVGGIEHNEHDNIKIAMLPVGESNVEFVEPQDSKSQIGKFLEQNGEGLHHLAFEVKDINAELEKLKEKGVPLIDKVPRTGHAGCKIAFLDHAASKVRIELVQY